MDRLRLMPEREKFLHTFEIVRLYQKQVLPFVEAHLGYAEMHKLRSVWQAGIIPIHEGASEHDKYERAYSNWLWMARCSHSTLAEEGSTEEVLDYKRLLLRVYEQQVNNPDLAILRLFRNHAALAKALLYEMQWLTPVELTKLSKAEVTCAVHDCKILQSPGTAGVCRVDCSLVGTALARSVYHLKRETTPADHGCTITLTRLEN